MEKLGVFQSELCFQFLNAVSCILIGYLTRITGIIKETATETEFPIQFNKTLDAIRKWPAEVQMLNAQSASATYPYLEYLYDLTYHEFLTENCSAVGLWQDDSDEKQQEEQEEEKAEFLASVKMPEMKDFLFLFFEHAAESVPIRNLSILSYSPTETLTLLACICRDVFYFCIYKITLVDKLPPGQKN